MNPFRRPTLVLGALGLLSAAVVMGWSLVAQGSNTKPTVSKVLIAAEKALIHESGVHVKVVTKTGRLVSSVSADIGTSDGRETYVSGNETFTITVTPSFAYLSGSPTGLIKVMGLTPIQQRRVGRDSIAMKKGSAPYASFNSNLTARALVHLLPPSKGTTLLVVRTKVSPGYQLKWKTPASSSQPAALNILTISSRKSALPVREVVLTSFGSSTTTFSKWGEKVNVKVPSTTIPYAVAISAKG